MSRRTKVSEQLRDAVAASGMSRRQISAKLGVTEGLLSHFMAGRKGLSMPVLDRLAELLGRELVARPEGPAACAGRPAPSRPARAGTT
jgi:transcriptional regulator with XRE-family HTH domain